MEEKKLNRFFAVFVALISFIVYYLTVAPTVSYWDCGEFIASSFKMAVPHPPGAPLYLLVGRIFTLLPIFADIAKRVNFISTLSSVFTIMFLYLIISMLIKQYLKDATQGFLKYVPYLGGVIGSLTFAFTTSFWFNATEAEVYAPSMLFTSLVVWMVLFWSERSDQIGNEKYLLVIMYLVGLATGVHLLNVLALPMVFMIIYYKKYPVNKNTFIYLILAGLLLTGLVYPGIVQGIPEIADAIGFFGILVLVTVIILILVYALNNKKQLLSLLITSVLLIVIGYSTYLVIYIRSNLDPNIDENNPETVEKFISYVKREQYGEQTLDRSKALANSPNRRQYNGPWDFFWDYQVNKMYVRYFLWNFLGEEGREGPVRVFKFLGIPFLLGLAGVYYHFRRDWKHALAVFVLFFMTGLAIIVYLNQPDPQPRERDYSYVGSFFAFSIWIGIGAAAILEWFARNTQKSSIGTVLPTAVAGILFLVSPLQVLVKNYDSHDRSGNYVPWDYSYNMLVSCEPNGIMYTNGDNDTFPLWYLQEVEGIRPDVRVANLSLLNTSWYVKQLKHKEPKVPISLSDARIEQLQPVKWPDKRTVEIDLPQGYVEREWENYMNSYRIGNASKATKIKFNLGPQMYKRYLRVQDYMILNTLYANRFQKPMYFAVTTSRGNMLDGLQSYLRMDGLVFKITSFKNWSIDPDILEDNLFNKYKYRNLDNPDVYYNENIMSLLQNYRSAFIQLANYYSTIDEKEKVRRVLEKMEEVIPRNVIPYTSDKLKNWVETYKFYTGILSPDSLNNQRYSPQQLKDMGRLLANMRQYDMAQKAFEEILKTNPDDIQAKSFLVDIYANNQEYEKSVRILEDWLKRNPGDVRAKKRLEKYRKELKPQMENQK